MSLNNRILILTLVATFTAGLTGIFTQVCAQGLGNSPYSSLGVGEFYGEAYSDNIGMGQSGVSTASGFQINNLNPALWVRNRFTTLDIALVGQYKDITSGARRQGTAGGNLGYVSLSFPVHPRWVIGVNLKPYSFIDYQNTFTRPVAGTPATAYYTTNGKGGINKASITNAFAIGKYLNIGVESSYYFGNVRRASEVQLPASNPEEDYIVSLNDRTTYRDIAFRAGAALRIPIKPNKMNLNLGGAYSFRTNIASTRTTSFEVTQRSFPVINPDTLENDVATSLTLPEQFQVGASLEWPFKLVLSADVSYQSWSKYKGITNAQDIQLSDAGRVHLGAEYLPRFNSLKYFDLVRYRAGVSFGQTPYTVNNRTVNDVNVSIGATLPMGRLYQNFLSIGIVAGQRGSAKQNQIQERYFRGVLGITLLERWFTKQKLD